MFLDGLDELDQKIVQLLIKNARISYSELGEQVGISRVAVKMRVQALEKRGIIEEYTTIVNPQKISGAVSCYFEMEFLPEALAQATTLLFQNETVTQIYRVTGRDKLHVHAVASSQEEMEKLIQETIDRLPGVVSCSCNSILSRIKEYQGAAAIRPGTEIPLFTAFLLRGQTWNSLLWNRDCCKNLRSSLCFLLAFNNSAVLQSLAESIGWTA